MISYDIFISYAIIYIYIYSLVGGHATSQHFSLFSNFASRVPTRIGEAPAKDWKPGLSNVGQQNCQLRR